MNENQIQKAVFQHFKARKAPRVFAFHPKNGGIHQRGRRRGINAGLGVVSGVPDIIAIKEGQVYALELKTENGRPTEQQFKVIEEMRDAGAMACIVYGLDRAIACLETWGLLTGKAS